MFLSNGSVYLMRHDTPRHNQRSVTGHATLLIQVALSSSPFFSGPTKLTFFPKENEFLFLFIFIYKYTLKTTKKINTVTVSLTIFIRESE